MIVPQTPSHRHYVWWLIIGIGSVLMVGYGLWSARSSVSLMADWLDILQVGLTFWRLVLIVTLIGFWSYWVRLLARYRAWPEETVQFLLAQRWRIASWLIIIEMVLMQHIFIRFFDAIIP